MTLLDDFQRVTRSNPCPVCDRQKYCLHGKEGTEYADTTICTKIESPRKWGDAGWLHGTPAGSARNWAVIFRAKFRAQQSRDEKPSYDILVKQSEQVPEGVADYFKPISAATLQRLEARLLTREQVANLDTTCIADEVVGFPMKNVHGEYVGMRLRAMNGFKYALNGSQQGLFIPIDLGACDPLFILEGPTDTAAMLEMGFDAIGRPSCNGCESMIAEYIHRHDVRSVVLLADRDEPGQEGAAKLATMLLPAAEQVMIAQPPDPMKDVRQWVENGATRVDFERLVEKTKPIKMDLWLQVGGRVNDD